MPRNGRGDLLHLVMPYGIIEHDCVCPYINGLLIVPRKKCLLNFNQNRMVFIWQKMHLKMMAVLCGPQSWICSPISPAQNGHHFADDIFRCIFMNEKFCILIKISLKFVLKGPVDKKSIGLENVLVPTRQQAIIWTKANLIPWHICGTRGRWVNVPVTFLFHRVPVMGSFDADIDGHQASQLTKQWIQWWNRRLSQMRALQAGGRELDRNLWQLAPISICFWT